MDTKQNKETVICFRVDSREARALQACLENEERPGVASLHKLARDIVVDYLARKRQKQLVEA